jgi:tRNA(Ile)-lysidine synthase
MTLSVPRRANVLRTWIKRQGMSAPASLITRMLVEGASCRSARWPLGAAQLTLHRGVIRLEPATVPVTLADPREANLSILNPGVYVLPGWSGALHVEPVRNDGVPLAWLAHIELRARAGAEQFQAGFARPPRSLKKQYQDAGLAMWQRTGPLIYSGGQLVFVPGLGLDARVIGFAPQQLVTLDWRPLSSPV